MNIGSLMSLISCNKCGYPIEIFPSQKEVRCKYCGKINNLEINDFNEKKGDKI